MAPESSLETSGIDAWLHTRAFAEALTETTQTLVCVLDREGRILLFNDACERLTGFSRGDVLGTHARDCVIPPEERPAFADMLTEVWATGLPSPQVGHWTTRDGGRLLVAWSNKPVLDDDGVPLYLVTTGLDITERQRTEAELRALEGDVKAKLAEIGRLAQEQAALRRVATLVAAEAAPERVFESVSEECARVLGTGAAAVFRFDPGEIATVVGRYDREGIGAFPLGSSVPLGAPTAIRLVLETGEPARIDDYTTISGPIADIMRAAGLRFTVAAPITVAGATWGAVAVSSTTLVRPAAGSEARLGDFCELVSLAVASAQARDDVRASRARLVHAADTERRRLERNLHDGAQQRLISLSIALRLARAKHATDAALVESLLESAVRDVEEAIRELREIARGLHPAILTDRGLPPALGALAARSPLPVELRDLPAERLPESLEAAAYYIVAEALTNVAKHACATRATVSVRRRDDVVSVEVCDDGRGGATMREGSGLLGLRDRVDALGGSLALTSARGRGTAVRALLPL
jgi:PAS domain S-box-containing protein